MTQSMQTAEDQKYLLYGQAAEEVKTALREGRPPDVEALIARHPDLAERIRDLVETLMVVQAIGPDSSGASAPAGSGVSAPGDEPTGTLGDFRIIREIGRGGMGIVYEAEQISLGRRVALKVLPFAGAMDAKQLQRFKNESHAAAQLHHTNIVPVYYVGVERGVHFYAMQFIEGHSLANVIAELRGRADGTPAKPQPSPSPLPDATVDAPVGKTIEPVSSAVGETKRIAALSTVRSTKDAAYFRTVAQLGIQAAEALDHAHQMGIVHRDIKPANLLVDANGRLWITDFGLAQIQSDTRLTMTGDLVGTLRYMSPEQALAKRVVVDHRTDVYSLGATLYELLMLAPAFDGTDRQELLRQIAFEEPKPPRRINKAIPGELETVVQKAMEKNPADRYGTAQELADDISRFLEDKPIRARRPPLWLRLQKWGRRHKPLVASLAAGLLTLLVVGTVLAVGYQRRLMETERGVTAALVDAETLVDEGDKLIDHPERWQAKARLAMAALEKAEELLAAGPTTGSLTRRVAEVRTAVEAALADSGLLIELERIRLEQATNK